MYATREGGGQKIFMDVIDGSPLTQHSVYSCLLGRARRRRRARAKHLHPDVALLDAAVLDQRLPPPQHEPAGAADVEVALLARFGHEVAGLLLQVALSGS